MNRKRIALAAVAVAALAGTGTAIAAGGHTRPARSSVVAPWTRPAPPGLDAAVTYLGTTASALETQLRSGKTLAQIAAATAGKSAQGLIDALVADAKARLGANAPSDLTQRITDMVNGVGRPWHDRGMMHGPRGGGLQLAATYLGTTASALETQLRSGKTLAQIANATAGKSAQGLIDALVADARTHITAFVDGTAG